MFKQFLRWFRRTSLFDWHNQRIKFLEESLRKSWLREEETERHRDVLQRRIDEWIERREASIRPYQVRINIQEETIKDYRKMLEWIYDELKIMYPRLKDRARENVQITRWGTAKKPYNSEP